MKAGYRAFTKDRELEAVLLRLVPHIWVYDRLVVNAIDPVVAEIQANYTYQTKQERSVCYLNEGYIRHLIS